MLLKLFRVVKHLWTRDVFNSWTKSGFKNVCNRFVWLKLCERIFGLICKALRWCWLFWFVRLTGQFQTRLVMDLAYAHGSIWPGSMSWICHKTLMVEGLDMYWPIVEFDCLVIMNYFKIWVSIKMILLISLFEGCEKGICLVLIVPGYTFVFGCLVCLSGLNSTNPSRVRLCCSWSCQHPQRVCSFI